MSTIVIQIPYESKIFINTKSKKRICPEVIEWLNNHIGKKIMKVDWDITSKMNCWRHSNHYFRDGKIYMNFCFKSKEDAMLFKLTWGGK